MLRGASELTLIEKKLSAIQCTSVQELDRASGAANSGYKWPLESGNGLSKRILEVSLASITPYFRQASMKRAARSNCLILPRRQEEKDTGRRSWWEQLSETSIVSALMSVIPKHTSALSYWCHSNSQRELLSPLGISEHEPSRSKRIGQRQIDAEVGFGVRLYHAL